MNNTIILIGSGRHVEHVAAAALTPGNLVELTSADKVQKHSTEGGIAEKLFAVEDALQGRTIDDDYAADDPVMLFAARPGDELYVQIKAGENIAIGDKLISAGDGTLIEEGSEGSGVTVREVVAVAREAVDLSGSGAVATRIAVRIV